MNDEQRRVARSKALPIGPGLFFAPVALSGAYLTLLHCASSALLERKIATGSAVAGSVNRPWYLVTKILLHSKLDAYHLAAFPLLAIALLWHRRGALPVGRLGLLGVTRTSGTKY